MSNSDSLRHILAIELNSVRKTFFLDKNNYSLGRNSTNSIVIHHRAISRIHANFLKVSYQGINSYNDVFWIVDGDLKGNRSTNGIYVNGKRCFSKELLPGDLILFGDSEVKAKYDIVDINEKTLFSVTKNNSKSSSIKEGLARETSPEDSNKLTFVADRDNEAEPLTEYFVDKINEAKDLLPYPIISINPEGEIIEINELARDKFSDLDALGVNHPILANLTNFFRDHQTNFLSRQIIVEGKKFTQYAYYEKQANLISSYIFDLQKRQQLELILNESDRRYHSLVKQISEGIFVLDIDSNKILDANGAYCNLLGYSREEILKLTIYDLVAIDGDILEADLEKIITQKIPFIRESVHRRQDNSLVNVEVSVSCIAYLGKQALCFCVRDITERKKAEEIFRYQASHDALTNLPNQKLFYEQLSTSIAHAKQHDETLSIIVINCDNLQKLTYIFGNKLADRLLQSFAARIKTCLLSGDTIARWGYDEFILLLPNVDNESKITNICEAILAKVKGHFTIALQKYFLSICMGIAIYPHHGDSVQNLLKNAQEALSLCRQKKGVKYRFYSPQPISPWENRFKLENLLYGALKNQEEFFLLYQPQVHLKNKEVIGMEASLQWRNQELGELKTEDFLPLLAATDLLIPLERWLLKTACQQHWQWQQDNLHPPKLVVRIHALYLQEKILREELNQILAGADIPPSSLELGIVGVNLVEEKEIFNDNLRELIERGTSIYLADFGGGDSSFMDLQKYPFNKLSISSSLINNLNRESENFKMVAAIISLASDLSRDVIIQSVSDVAQRDLLADLGCQQMQGEVFCHPLSLELASKFLAGDYQDLTKIVDGKIIFNLTT